MDIVSRLRRKAPSLGLEDHDPTFDDRQEAAREIEMLRGALRRIAAGEVDSGGNRRSHPYSMSIANEALGRSVR